MEKSQQLGKDIAKNKVKQSENYQLNHSGTEQQFNSGVAEEIAYNVADHHMTYKKNQHSYNEQRRQYAEQALNDHSVEEQGVGSDNLTYNYEQNREHMTEHNQEKEFTNSYGIAASALENHSSSPILPTSYLDSNLLSGTTEKYGISMTAKSPELWENTYIIQKNDELIEKLDGKRKDVQQGYTRLTLNIGSREISTKSRLQFNYYGRAQLSDNNVELLRVGRLKYEGQIIKAKRNQKDYEDLLRKNDNRAFKRRAAGRLLFSKCRSLINDENIAEDDDIASTKRIGKLTARTTAMSVRKNIRTLRQQNNVYARLQLADMKKQVLNNQRERLLSDSKRKMQRQQLRELQSRKQKQKLKKKMVQQRAKEEGNFFQRAKQQFMVKKTAYEYRQQVKKRTMSTIWSLCGLIMVIIMMFMFLILFVLAATQGGTEYYATAVTQNDYGTLTDATSYFQKLETDLDEYLNADRNALEAELDTEYGPDIYEYIYVLDDFGFRAGTLIAYLSAVYGEFTLEDVKEELNEIFMEMYTLTIEVKVEKREIEKYNPNTSEYETVTELKNICYVTLDKKELEEIIEERLTDDLKFQYEAYKLSTGGQQVYGPVMREDWTNIISSNYGERIHPITKVRTFHKGVDIAVPEGTKLYSAVTGVVTISKFSDSAGNYVTVQTDSGWTVTFMHMSMRAVSVNQKVEQGDFIGFSGNTGNSTGPHLHLQVADQNGNTVNPIFIIPQTCAVKETEE